MTFQKVRGTQIVMLRAEAKYKIRLPSSHVGVRNGKIGFFLADGEIDLPSPAKATQVCAHKSSRNWHFFEIPFPNGNCGNCDGWVQFLDYRNGVRGHYYGGPVWGFKT